MKRYYAHFLLLLFIINCSAFARDNVIKVGILHSLSGVMASSEKPLVDALMLAIEQINSQGGILGKKVQAIIVDNKSDWTESAKQAEALIVKEQVSAIFGCWTSACRKAVKPIVEKHNNLLFYPLQYEGLESSSNIIYSGATPNQQIIPSVNWLFERYGKDFYLIGSDYVFPHIANQIVKDVSQVRQLNIVKEQYFPLDAKDFSTAIKEIKQLQPKVIINTINGQGNIAFFNQLDKAGLNHIPIISYSVSETELQLIPSALRDNHYLAWNYFQSINSELNKQFVTLFKQRYGEQRVIGDPMVTSYNNIFLWANSVQEVNSERPEQVNKNITNQSLNTQAGILSFDATTRHLWKKARIGQVQKSGQIIVVWRSKSMIRPRPYPLYRSRYEWNELIKSFTVQKEM